MITENYWRNYIWIFIKIIQMRREIYCKTMKDGPLLPVKKKTEHSALKN